MADERPGLKRTGYSRTKTREESAGMVRRPNMARLEAALAIGRGLIDDDRWIFDAKVFHAWPEQPQSIDIGNLPGYMAYLNQLRGSGFQLHPMGGGIPLFTANSVRNSLSRPQAVPAGIEGRWYVDNVSWVCADAETFGWHAVCEYFSLGMWDARRIFQGYGYPEIPTLAATLGFLETFVNHRREADRP